MVTGSKSVVAGPGGQGAAGGGTADGGCTGRFTYNCFVWSLQQPYMTTVLQTRKLRLREFKWLTRRLTERGRTKDCWILPPKPELFLILSPVASQECPIAFDNQQVENKLMGLEVTQDDPSLNPSFISSQPVTSNNLRLNFFISKLRASLAPPIPQNCEEDEVRQKSVKVWHKHWRMVPIFTLLLSFRLYGFTIYEIKIKTPDLHSVESLYDA